MHDLDPPSMRAPTSPAVQRCGAGWALAVALLSTVCWLTGCGPTVPKGGVAKAPASPTATTAPTEATDLIPADLDLVVRVDLSKVRASLGDDASEDLLERAFDADLQQRTPRIDPVVRDALAEAEVVWLALRVADFETGDRVLAVRARMRRTRDSAAAGGLKPSVEAWTSSSTKASGVTRFVAKSTPPRHGTARIYTLGKRNAVFVSPVEEHAVERLVSGGRDASRGLPQARGLVSVHYRASRLSVALAEDFPSLAALVAGIAQVSAIVDVTGQRLELDGRIRCRSEAAAQKVLRFFETIRDASEHSERTSGLLSELQLSRSAANVHIRWPLPREVVVSLLSDERDN